MKIIKEGSIWSYKDYLRLWISGLLVNIGATAFPIALAVTILDTGGNATSLGLILAARVLSESYLHQLVEYGLIVFLENT